MPPFLTDPRSIVPRLVVCDPVVSDGWAWSRTLTVTVPPWEVLVEFGSETVNEPVCDPTAVPLNERPAVDPLVACGARAPWAAIEPVMLVPDAAEKYRLSLPATAEFRTVTPTGVLPPVMIVDDAGVAVIVPMVAGLWKVSRTMLLPVCVTWNVLVLSVVRTRPAAFALVNEPEVVPVEVRTVNACVFAVVPLVGAKLLRSETFNAPPSVVVPLTATLSYLVLLAASWKRSDAPLTPPMSMASAPPEEVTL